MHFLVFQTVPLLPPAAHRYLMGLGISAALFLAGPSLPCVAAESVSTDGSSLKNPARSTDIVTPNIIVRGTSLARASAIRGRAERLRCDAFVKLLGENNPPPWIVKCEIHVHPTATSFGEAVGSFPADARGATSLEFVGESVVSRRIDLLGDGSDVIPDALAHELVHVVLADHFKHFSPPRWADEGLALLFDKTDKQRGHADDLRRALTLGVAWSASDLLTLKDYPQGSQRQRVFYGQSAALVRWLIARKDTRTFIEFIDDAAAVGLPASLERHYQLDSIASIHSAWKEVAPIHMLQFADHSNF